MVPPAILTGGETNEILIVSFFGSSERAIFSAGSNYLNSGPNGTIINCMIFDFLTYCRFDEVQPEVVTRRWRFSREFKLEAVKPVKEHGVSAAQAAGDLDVQENVRANG